MIRPIGTNCNLTRINLLKDRHVKPEPSGLLGKLNNLKLGLTLFGALNIAGCGSDTIIGEIDGGKTDGGSYDSGRYINDAGQTCLPVDYFKDNNLISETMNAEWAALPGTKIIFNNGTMRTEGRRLAADGKTGVILTPLGDPPSVKDFDTLLADIKVGLLSDPTAYILIRFNMEISGNSEHGIITTGIDDDIHTGVSYNKHLVYGYSPMGAGYTPEYMSKVTIALQPNDDAEYFMEVQNLQFCLTNQPIFY